MAKKQVEEYWENEYYAYSLNALGKPFDFKNKSRLVGSFVSYFFNKVCRMFEYEDFDIPVREVELSLIKRGYVCLKEIDGKGYALWGGLGGVPNAYYLPTTIVVANPYLKYNATLTIDKDCVVGWNDTTHIGLYPLIQKYATLLAEIELSADIKVILSRLAYLISVGDNKTKASVEKVIKDLYDGEIGIALDNALLEKLSTNPLTDSGKVGDFIELEQYYLSRLLNELGLSSNYNMKRESLNSNETQLEGDNELTLVQDMLKCREEMIEKYNKMYNKHAKVKLSPLWMNNRVENIQLVKDEITDGEIEIKALEQGASQPSEDNKGKDGEEDEKE